MSAAAVLRTLLRSLSAESRPVPAIARGLLVQHPPVVLGPGEMVACSDDRILGPPQLGQRAIENLASDLDRRLGGRGVEPGELVLAGIGTFLALVRTFVPLIGPRLTAVCLHLALIGLLLASIGEHVALIGKHLPLVGLLLAPAHVRRLHLDTRVADFERNLAGIGGSLSGIGRGLAGGHRLLPEPELLFETRTVAVAHPDRR